MQRERQASGCHYLDTGGEAPSRKVGFASPSEAFGHRELLGALEAYGSVRVSFDG